MKVTWIRTDKDEMKQYDMIIASISNYSSD